MKVLSPLIDFVALIGMQMTFLRKVLQGIPAALTTYRAETFRILADLCWGTGAILVGGGTVGVMAASSRRSPTAPTRNTGSTSPSCRAAPTATTACSRASTRCWREIWSRSSRRCRIRTLTWTTISATNCCG